MSDYPGTTAADVQTVLADIAPSTRTAIIQALTANGLLSPDSGVGITVQSTPSDNVFVDTTQNKVVVLSPNAATQVNSTGPVVVAVSQGNNYVDLSHYARQDDRRATVIGGSGSDTIVGNTARSSLVAGSGDALVSSGGGRDTIVGGSGQNTLIGGGQSQIKTGSGSALIKAGQDSSAHDTVQVGSGSATVRLSDGDNVVRASGAGGKATITAGSGHDTIFGPAANQGAMTINGGASTTLNIGSGSVKFNLGRNDADTVFGSSASGYLNLNRSTKDIASTSVTTDAAGQKQTTITFASGGSITAVGTVNLTFTDTRKHS